MSLPKVSVLVPVYNAGPFFAECLESILVQDFGDYEVLISNDGSTDGTVAIIERYAAKDPCILWWKNPLNIGLTRNHNHFLREARGEFRFTARVTVEVPLRCIPRMQMALGFFLTSFIAFDPIFCLVFAFIFAGHCDANPALTNHSVNRTFLFSGTGLTQDAGLIKINLKALELCLDKLESFVKAWVCE